MKQLHTSMLHELLIGELVGVVALVQDVGLVQARQTGCGSDKDNLRLAQVPG
ncbi:hypothetical protein D3C71_2106210 [compost metagenome]